MVLTALILAAAVQAADPAPLAPGFRSGPTPLPNPPQTERRRALPGKPPIIAEKTPNLYRVPDRCKAAPVKVVDRFGRPIPQKLGDLPKGALIYAVDKRVDGCPVLVVAYGTPALDNPNPAPPAGVEPAAPAKYAPSPRR